MVITSQSTGALGTAYTFFLIGQRAFFSLADALTYVSSTDHTLEKTREEQVHILKMGLMRYIVRTPMSVHTSITFTDEMKDGFGKDKLDNWIIRLFPGGMLSWERTYKYSNIWGGFNTTWVTEGRKIELCADMGRNVDKYKLDEGDIISANQMYVTDALAVKSIGTHWSAGAKTGHCCQGSSEMGIPRCLSGLEDLLP
jgi:hypothetical protein